MAFVLGVVLLVIIAFLQISLPYFVKRTVIFGVAIPEQFIKDEPLKVYKKQYFLASLILSLFLMVAFVVWAMLKEPSEGALVIMSTLFQFVIIFSSILLYFHFHKKVKNYKLTMNWSSELKEVGVADLSIRSIDNMPPWYIYIFPIVVTIGLIVYTLTQYSILPNDIPTHWGISGEADGFTEKSYFSSIQLLVVLLVMQIMFMAIQIGMKNSGIKLSATNVQASANRQLLLRKYTSWFLYFTILLITIMFAFFQLQTIHPNMFPKYVQMALPFVAIIGILGGSIGLLVKVGFADKGIDVQVSDSIMDQDDDKYWKGGLFYFNRNDPSIFVEKRFGVGWTINFANPKAYFVLIVPIAIILILSYL